MPQMTWHETGTPSWIELASPDLDRSKAFYGGLFGWYACEMVDVMTGDYELFTVNGVTGPEVAGLVPLADDSMPPTWTIYFTVRDLTGTIKAIRAAGGEVFVDEVDMGHMGAMAVACDTEGAEFALWQPGELHGASMLDEPNSMCWVELACRDPVAAQDFYGQVLGWKEPSEFQGAHGGTSYLWRVGGRLAATMVAGGAGARAEGDHEIPARWVPYFGVADCDASASAAVRLGGTVTSSCVDTPNGRCAGLSDSTSAPLSIVQLRS
jgi:predicted enzyme related to lactoylglutathione lyase